jgi:hypothetical protein
VRWSRPSASSVSSFRAGAFSPSTPVTIAGAGLEMHGGAGGRSGTARPARAPKDGCRREMGRKGGGETRGERMREEEGGGGGGLSTSDGSGGRIWGKSGFLAANKPSRPTPCAGPTRVGSRDPAFEWSGVHGGWRDELLGWTVGNWAHVTSHDSGRPFFAEGVCGVTITITITLVCHLSLLLEP